VTYNVFLFVHCDEIHILYDFRLHLCIDMKMLVAGEWLITGHTLRDHFFYFKMTHIITSWSLAHLVQNMLHNVSSVPSSSPQTNISAGNKKNGLILSHIRLCYPFMPSFPLTLHAMFWYSVPSFSSSSSNSNNHERTTKNRTLCWKHLSYSATVLTDIK
jgi:hypothetical protein